jgi:hypothetical protein
LKFIVALWRSQYLAPVRDALKLYLDQDSRRSLRRLAEECSHNGIKASLPTLKRWSLRYDWQRHVAEHDQAAGEKSIAITIDYRIQAMQDHLRLIDSAKERYYWLIDPDNPNVTPAQRERATKMNVRDFLRVLKIEERLIKRLEEMKPAEPARPKQEYTAEELDAMMRALAEVRYGLPPRRPDRNRHHPGCYENRDGLDLAVTRGIASPE